MFLRARTRVLRRRCEAASAFYGTFDNEVLMVNLAERTDRLALSTSATKVSVLLISGSDGESQSWSAGATSWFMD